MPRRFGDAGAPIRLWRQPQGQKIDAASKEKISAVDKETASRKRAGRYHQENTGSPQSKHGLQ
jgi:hypothetical protein